MLADDLRKAVLQAAIQGKLVPQDPKDEPASLLLERIREEKQRLISEKKIKKEVPLKPITDDEILFDIPESWVWVRLDSLASFLGGYAYKSINYVPCSDNQVIRLGNVKNDRIILDSNPVFISNEYAKETSFFKLTKDDILITMTGTKMKRDYFYTAIMTSNILLNKNLYLNQRVGCLRTFRPINSKWLCSILKSKDTQDMIFANETGTANQGNIGSENIKKLLIPLPPINEQNRIVQKLKLLMHKIDEFSLIENELKSLKSDFPVDLKKSLLQAAIQGKLTEQLSTDSSVDELLENIKAEKNRLVAEKKIKKEKPLVPIREDEIPFDIPESWRWLRLGSICQYIQRGKSPKYSSIKKYPVVAQKCNQWSGFSLEKALFIDPDSINSYTQDRFLQDGDLMWNSTGLGTLGRIAIYESTLNPYELAVADSHVTVIRTFKSLINYKYLYLYFSNPTVQLVIEEQSSGTTKQKELSTNTVKNYIVPLPPIEEQIRIVEKLDKLIPYCKSII